MELTTFYLTNKTRNGYYQSRKFVTINKEAQTLTFENIDQSSGVELKSCIVLVEKDWWTIKENRKDVETEPWKMVRLAPEPFCSGVRRMDVT